MGEDNNLREFSRVNVPVRVEIERANMELFCAVAFDVSLNGIRIQSAEPFDAELRCDVKIILGEQEPLAIEARGCVVRSDGEYVAIHFDELDLEGYSILKNLILYNSPDSNQVEREFEAHVGLHKRE